MARLISILFPDELNEILRNNMMNTLNRKNVEFKFSLPVDEDDYLMPCPGPVTLKGKLATSPSRTPDSHRFSILQPKITISDVIQSVSVKCSHRVALTILNTI